jgi:hypothetical protein
MSNFIERPFQNGSATDGELTPKLTMDAFLQDIHARGKLKSDFAAINQAKKAEREFGQRERRRTNRGRSITSLSFGNQSSNQPLAESKKIKLDADSVFTQFKQHDQDGTCPQIQEILFGASALAAAGNVEGVRVCQKILAEHDEDIFNSEMRLDHQLANALWNSGEYDESIKISKQIFYDYPLKRRKLANIFRFSVLRAMKEYPCPEQMALLREFAQYCSKLQNSMPLTHLWQSLFQHPVPGANEEAFQLILEYPQLKSLVTFKLDPLLQKARTEQQSDVLFRILPLLGILGLSEKDLRHLTGCVWDALMDIYCANEDVEGAKDLIRMVQEQSRNGKVDYMWPETVKKYVNLSGLTRVAVPSELLTAKPVPPPLKF